MSGGFGGVGRSARRHRTRAARGPRAHQDQHGRAARRQRSHAARPAGALPRHRRHRALHRIHGRRHAQPLEARRWSCRRASSRRASTRAGRSRRASANYRGEVAERYAFEDGTGEVGFISSVSQPFCGDCSRARLSSDGSFYTCLFATQGIDLRGPLRAGATDDELFELIRGIWSGAPRPLQRAARLDARRRRPAQGRDELHRRLTDAAHKSRLTHLDAANRPTMVDVGAKTATLPRGQRRSHASNYRRRWRARSRAPAIARRRARCSTPPSSPASWPPSARTRLIPFCHPLALERCTVDIASATRRHASASSAASPCTTRPASRWKR